MNSKGTLFIFFKEITETIYRYVFQNGRHKFSSLFSEMTGKLKILCLHGYRQNAVRFRNQTGSLRKILKNEAEFYYLSAPLKIPKSEVGEGDEDDPRAWWFTKPNSFSSRDETDTDEGLEESLKEIEKFFNVNGPFHGILGFSQGAALTGILCALKQRNEIDLSFQFVIIVSGFKSLCNKHSKYYEQKIDIISLHVVGESDQLITSDKSFELANLFNNSVILTHPGGHFVPGQSALKANYIDFLTSLKIT